MRVKYAQCLPVLESVKQAEQQVEKHLLSGQVCFKLTPHNSENEFLIHGLILTKQRGIQMANVEKVGEVYRCEICGNVVEVKKVGGGELVCCGQPMKLEKG
jgi:desulfoferrodoxin-like iron-binding protein